MLVGLALFKHLMKRECYYFSRYLINKTNYWTNWIFGLRVGLQEVINVTDFYGNLSDNCFTKKQSVQE